MVYYILVLKKFLLTPAGIYSLIASILIFTIFLLYKSIAYKMDYNIKINNFYFTWFCAILYFIFFICGIIGLRFLQLQNSINLIEIKNKILSILTKIIALPLSSEILIILLIIIAILCWVLIVICLNKRLRFKVFTLFFYFHKKKVFRKTLKIAKKLRKKIKNVLIIKIILIFTLFLIFF